MTAPSLAPAPPGSLGARRQPAFSLGRWFEQPNVFSWLMVTPPVLFLAALVGYPLFYGIWLSLMDRPGDNRGFWLDPAWQGQGYMAEASTAVTDYWFDVLEKPVLQVPKARANDRSRRISEVTGMRVIATYERDYVSGRLLAEVWEITRDEWRARRGR